MAQLDNTNLYFTVTKFYSHQALQLLSFVAMAPCALAKICLLLLNLMTLQSKELPHQAMPDLQMFQLRMLQLRMLQFLPWLLLSIPRKISRGWQSFVWILSFRPKPVIQKVIEKDNWRLSSLISIMKNLIWNTTTFVNDVRIILLPLVPLALIVSRL